MTDGNRDNYFVHTLLRARNWPKTPISPLRGRREEAWVSICQQIEAAINHVGITAISTR